MGAVYIGVVLPVAGYLRLRPARGRSRWRQALAFVGVVLACYLLSILGGIVGFFAAGAPIDLPVAGLSDRIRYTNVGPDLVSWATREMAAHLSPPSKPLRPGTIFGGEFPLPPTELPRQARWIARKGCTFSVIRGKQRLPIGIVIGADYGTGIAIYPDPKLEPADRPVQDEDQPPLHPYPGITVRHYVR